MALLERLISIGISNGNTDESVDDMLASISNPYPRCVENAQVDLQSRHEMNPEARDSQLFAAEMISAIHGGNVDKTIGLLQLADADIPTRLDMVQRALINEANVLRTDPLLTNQSQAQRSESRAALIEEAKVFYLQHGETASPEYTLSD